MAIPAITNNTPAGGITWAGFTIQYLGVTYSIPGGSTTNRWVWWKYNGGVGTTIESGMTLPETLTDDDLVLFTNRNGIGFRVQSSSFVDGELLVDGSIFAEALSTNLINSTHIVTAGLDAGVIKFGTMSGDRIAANTIAASKLLVTDLQNMIENPLALVGTVGQTPPGWSSPATLANGTLPDGSAGQVLQITANGTVLDSANRTIEVLPDDEFWVSGYVKKVSGTDTSGTIFVLANTTTKSDGTLDYTSPASINISSLTTGAWAAFTGTVKMPAKAVKTTWRISVRNDVADGVYQFWGLQARRKSRGELLVDGTIKSDHIVTSGLDADVIKFGTMLGDRIEAGTLSAEAISTRFILARATIAALGADGRSVELSPTGFQVKGPTSENNPVYVNFPTEGAKPNIISGTLQASTLSIDGDPNTGQAATLRGNSQLEPGAFFTLNDKVVAPVGAPVFVSDTNLKSAAYNMSGDLRGACYVPAEDAVYFLSPLKSLNVWYNYMFKYSLATDTVTYVRTMEYAGKVGQMEAQSLTYFNSALHVGYYEESTNKAFVGKYDASYNQTASVDFGLVGGTRKSFGISNDGTNFWLADYGAPTTNAIRFRKYANTLATTVTETVDTTFVPESQSSSLFSKIISFAVGNFDFGARKFALAYTRVPSQGLGVNHVSYGEFEIFGNLGAREEANAFIPMDRSSIINLMWKGTSHNDAAGSFLSLQYENLQPTLGRFTQNRFTNGYFATWYAGYSFYRNSDAAETNLSPMSSSIVYSRWPYRVTVGLPPTGIQARVYLNQSGTSILNSRLQATLAVGATTLVGTSFNAAGANPKATNTFPTSAASSIQSQQTITQDITATRTSGSVNMSGNFQQYMVGRPISGTGIPAGATIVSVVTGSTAVLSAAATLSTTGIATLTLPKLEIRGNGYARISELERVIINSTTDATASAANEPALRVGNPSATHLRIDNNEILAMTGDSTQGNLTLNANGQVNVNNINVTGSIVGATRFDGVNVDFPNIPTGSYTSNANLNTGTSNRLRLNTSSKRFKENIKDLDIEAEKFLELRPRWFQRNDHRDPETDELLGYHEDNPWYPGFIAEEAEEIGLKHWVVYDSDDKPFSFAYDWWGIALQVVARKQKERIEELEAKVEEQEARLARLEARFDS